MPDELIAVAERQVVVGIDVQAPEELFFPRRHRVRTDRLDVDEGHQAQHPQQLFGSHHVREPFDDVRIVEIAAERNVGHLEMMTDEKFDRVPRIIRQLETIQRGTGDTDTHLRVVRILHLADVMEDERKREELGRAHLLQERAEPFAGCADRMPQRFEAADREERVLVDGVAMVEVPHDATVNAGELRQNTVQQTAIVHLGEARVQPGSWVEQVADLVTLRFGAGKIVGTAPCNVLLDAIQRLLRYGAPVREREPEGFEPERRPRRCAVDVHEANPVAGDLELTADQPLHAGIRWRPDEALAS
jgi:hypothetical protein